jgi:hypothetical protein
MVGPNDAWRPGRWSLRLKPSIFLILCPRRLRASRSIVSESYYCTVPDTNTNRPTNIFIFTLS